MGMEVGGGVWRHNWAVGDHESNREVPPVQWALGTKQLEWEGDRPKIKNKWNYTSAPSCLHVVHRDSSNFVYLPSPIYKVRHINILWDTTHHSSIVFLTVLRIQQICNTGHNKTKRSTCMNVQMLQHQSTILITSSFPPSPN
jgi:hypothetical protein